jgi:hypothetical protein
MFSGQPSRSGRLGGTDQRGAGPGPAGFELRIDHRSHQDCGLAIEPTQHKGVHATQMGRRGREVSRSRLDEAAAFRATQVRGERTTDLTRAQLRKMAAWLVELSRI